MPKKGYLQMDIKHIKAIIHNFQGFMYMTFIQNKSVTKTDLRIERIITDLKYLITTSKQKKYHIY